MINVDLSHVKSVKEFYKEIRAGQEAEHGDNYCAQHDAITRLIKDCDSYMELGTHQGGTAAAAMLCKPKKITLVDIDMHRYDKFLKPLADKFCKRHNISLNVKECSSIEIKSTAKTDLLLIDSVHNPNHMIQELRLHQINVKKYIVAHDTSVINGRPDVRLYECLESFCMNYPFKIVERETVNVGYAVLERK